MIVYMQLKLLYLILPFYSGQLRYVSNHRHCEIEMYHFRDFARDVSLS